MYRCNNIFGNPAFPCLIAFLGVFATNVFLQPRILTYRVLYSNISTFTPLMIASAAQAVVILSGNVDLSSGAMVSLLNVILASLFRDTPSSVLVGIAISLGVALAGGAVNGYAVGYLGFPSIVTTFATSFIWSGLALIILPQPGGYVPKWFYRAFQSGRLQFPVPFLLIGITLLFWWSLIRLPVGRKIYAVGGNRNSAFLTGIRHHQVILFAYLASSFFVALSAIAATGLVASGDARLGLPMTLSSIASAAIGGTSFRGGRGSIIGPMLGAVLLSLLSNIILLLGVPSLYQDFIKGAIVVAAIGFAMISQLRRKEG
jgi:ribose transport system permease protein